MADQQYRHAAGAAQGFQSIKAAGAHVPVQGAETFIKQQDGLVAQQRTGEGDALLLPPRNVTG